MQSLINRVTHGDCIQVLRQLPPTCIDFILTDPPYLVRYTDRDGRKITNDDNQRWMFPAFLELYRVLKPDRFLVSFYGWGRADRFLHVWRECGFYPIGHFVFVKTYDSKVSFTKMRHEQAYLLAKGRPAKPERPLADLIPWKFSGNQLHPTQKPVSALTPLVEAYSQPHDLILDPFAGSGSTGEAARQLQRRFLLIEKDWQYYQKARQRLV